MSGGDPVRLYCPTCRSTHLASVTLDATGWPRTRWAESHDAGDLDAAIARLGEQSGRAFASAAARFDWGWAETFAEVLARNDRDEEGEGEGAVSS